MEGIQGAVLGIKLKHLNDWTNERRRAAKKYKECLKGVDQIILPFEMEYAKHVYHLFVIQVKSKDKSNSSATRDELQKFLEANDISTGLHYPVPLHVQPCFNSLGYKKGDFPVAEALAERGLSLPVYPELTDKQIEYVAEKIKEFFK
jgi:dTDP-4-amino-4,6-dideoxygalactose transaminase